MMETGIKHSLETLVTNDKTALALGSGTLRVFATPALAALAEETAWKSVAPYLQEGQTTVGSRLEISHLSPTPLGMKVRCETELVAIDGRRLVFRLEASDERGLVASGTHERFIVQADKFQQKANGKALGD